MLTDIRNAFRALRAMPSFTAVALIILMLGIGASTAIFSVVDAVVLKGLPFDQADRLVSVTQRVRSTGQPLRSQAPQNYLDWRRGQQVLEGLAAVANGSGYVLRDGGGEGRNIRTARVTHELFAVLRVAPALGRTFVVEHEVEGRHQVAVLSYGLWQGQFGGDPDVVGRTMVLDNGVYEVLGVMPPGFTYPVGIAEPPEMWVPYVVPASERIRGVSRNFYLQLVGRLRPDVSVSQAEAQLERITAPLAAESPTWFNDREMCIRSLHEVLVGGVRSWMLLLIGVVGLVLLLTCANVANLLLARATAREHEISVRSALGASRWQIARGLLVESILLSITGASLGLLVAWAGIEVLRSAIPASVPRASDIGIDWRVLAMSGSAAIATGILFGLVPALHCSRPDLIQALRDRGRVATGGLAKQRMRGALVVGEVALAAALLVGSALFLTSFARVMAIDLGADYDRVLTLTVPLATGQRIADMTQADVRDLADHNQGALDAVLKRVQTVPGVDVAAILSGATPLTSGSNTTSVRVVSTGRTFGGPDSPEIKRITSGYHRALRIPLRAGRFFGPEDRKGSAPVVIINDVAATHFFEGRPALGETLNIYGDRTVVGIVGAVRQNGPEAPLPPEAYIPLAQSTILVSGDLVIRTTGSPAVLLPAIKRAVLAVLPNTAFPAPRTGEQLLETLVAQRRFNMLVFLLFGVLGLVIAVVGVYGVMTHLVHQRTAEFGVRIALGAQRGQILTMVLRRAVLLLATGLVGGIGISLALSRVVATFLFNVRPVDPVVLVAVSTVLVGAGLAAAFVPAFLASRVDPIVALRSS